MLHISHLSVLSSCKSLFVTVAHYLLHFLSLQDHFHTFQDHICKFFATNHYINIISLHKSDSCKQNCIKTPSTIPSDEFIKVNLPTRLLPQKEMLKGRMSKLKKKRVILTLCPWSCNIYIIILETAVAFLMVNPLLISKYGCTMIPAGASMVVCAR